MNDRNNSYLTKNAQQLRKNMTKEERRLWYECLKSLPVNVNRQKVIGSYIVDFYIAAARLAIELDGSQHFEAEGTIADAVRDEKLRSLGITVLRYSNADINLRFNEVCEDIYQHLETFFPKEL